MADIFISYRREDGQASAGRINDRLVEVFGQDRIFMDVDAITYGDDFVKAIEDAVSKCDVLIAVIGRNWVNLADENGTKRLFNPNDFVRIEIKAALQRNIYVIPVLVENATFPHTSDLPDDLKPLLRRNAIEIKHTSFNSDTNRLVSAINKILRSKGKSGNEEISLDQLRAKKKRKRLVLLLTFFAVAVAAAIFYFSFQRGSLSLAEDTFMMKARVISNDQSTQLFDEGEVIMYIGKEPKKSEIHNGEAVFYNIPSVYHQKAVKLETVIPGFETKDSGTVLISKEDDYIDIRVEKSKAVKTTMVRGSIMNEKNSPVKNALVNIASGLASGYTNDAGDFSFNVPLPEGESTRLKVLVDNVTLYNEDVVISSTTPINLKIDVSH